MVGRSVCHPAVEHAVWDADIRGSGMRIRERVRRMLAAVGGVERAVAGYRWCWAADPLPVRADLRLIAAQLRPELFRALRRISDRGRHLRNRPCRGWRSSVVIERAQRDAMREAEGRDADHRRWSLSPAGAERSGGSHVRVWARVGPTRPPGDCDYRLPESVARGHLPARPWRGAQA